jgi:RNA polymerase sigma-70 factor (ECF subfamily)
MSVAVPLTTNNFQKTDVGALATGNAWASGSWWQDFIQSRPATMSNDPDFNVLLLNVAGSNDKAALATLFRHFAPRLKSLMLRLGTDFHTAEELAQEAMLSVWRKSQMFDPTRASASTWIFTIARNLRIDRFRNESRPELDPKDPALVREPDLPEQREAVHLSFVEGLSHQEISDQLGLPLGTVKSRLRLSFSKLRLMLRNVS